jgi:hypothetical protein
MSPGNRSGQYPSNGGATDLQTAGDLGFAEAGTMQLSRFVRLEPGCYGSAQCLTVLSGVGQAGAHAFPQNFSFELANTASSAAMARPAGVVCHELPGSESAGETEEEARANIREAIGLYLIRRPAISTCLKMRKLVGVTVG